jgi:DNA helicase-2/ATP-dependent DNA helicase PcrA
MENIEEMIHGIEIYENKFRKKKPTLAGYLQEIALITSEADEETENKPRKGVVIMTLHKSKGLEFPVVFLAGLDSTYIPSPRALEEGKIDEERRLFYVAITRAKKVLYLTNARSRLLFGQIKSNIPSRFIEEINEEDLEKLFEETKSTKEIKINKKDNFNEEDLEIKAGDHVEHNAYKKGIVISVDKGIATIAFSNGIGIKKILTTYKGLKKI